MKAFRFRWQRKLAKKRMGYGTQEWWRKADDWCGKLAVEPEEHLGSPSPPRLGGPYEDLPRLSPSPRQQQQQPQDVQCPRAAQPRWELLLQAGNLLVLVYLCLSVGAVR